RVSPETISSTVVWTAVISTSWACAGVACRLRSSMLRRVAETVVRRANSVGRKVLGNTVLSLSSSGALLRGEAAGCTSTPAPRHRGRSSGGSAEITRIEAVSLAALGQCVAGAVDGHVQRLVHGLPLGPHAASPERGLARPALGDLALSDPDVAADPGGELTSLAGVALGLDGQAHLGEEARRVATHDDSPVGLDIAVVAGDGDLAPAVVDLQPALEDRLGGDLHDWAVARQPLFDAPEEHVGHGDALGIGMVVSTGRLRRDVPPEAMVRAHQDGGQDRVVEDGVGCFIDAQLDALGGILGALALGIVVEGGALSVGVLGAGGVGGSHGDFLLIRGTSCERRVGRDA